MRGLPRRGRTFALSLVLLWVLALASGWSGLTHQPDGRPRRPYPTGFDANGYYAHARSLWFDHDLDFRNDYTFIAGTQPPGTAELFAGLLKERPRRPENIFSVGTGIAALPALALASAVDTFRSLLTGEPRSSGFAPLYVFAFQAANVTYGVLAFWLAWGMARRHFGRSPATIGVWATVLCGPTLYYLFYDQTMSHLPGAFFGTAAVVSWLRWRRSPAPGAALGWAALAGFCVGFATCIRPYNMPLALLLGEPLAAAAWGWWREKQGSPARRYPAPSIPLPHVMTTTALAGAAAFLGFVPQLLAWKAQYGTWLGNPAGYQFHLVPPHALQVLFSPRHGLFYWAPALLVAVAALLVRAWRRPVPAAGLLLVFLGVTYMYGNWWCYWLGVAFGMRGYVDLPYVFVFGFAVAVAGLMARLGRKQGRAVAWELLVLFALVNFHLMFAFQSGAIWVDGPLHWLDTVSRGARYKRFLRLEAERWTDYAPGHRAPLFDGGTVTAGGVPQPTAPRLDSAPSGAGLKQ